MFKNYPAINWAVALRLNLHSCEKRSGHAEAGVLSGDEGFNICAVLHTH